MTYGEYRRTKPRLNFLRGWRGNEPQSLSLSAQPTANAGIKSGMLIVVDPNTGMWVKCDSASHGGLIPYWAVSDDTDTDVISSGLLLGVSALGEYELQTAYFNSSTTWAQGSPLIKGTGGLVGSVDKGASTLAAVEIVGFATRSGMEDIAKINTESLRDGNGKVLVLNFTPHWRPASA